MPIYLDTHLDCKNGRNITNLAAPDNTGKPLVFEDSFPVFNRNGHGFTVGTAIRHNGSIWVRADAQSAANLATHIVAKVIDANNFSAVSYHPNLIVGTHGITRGEIVYLSNTSGNLSGTAGTQLQVLGRAISSTGILVNITDRFLQTNQFVPSIVGNGFEGGNLTTPTTVDVTLAPGRFEFLDSSTGRIYLATLSNPLTIALNGLRQIGTWGNGTQYVFLGYNPSTVDFTIFASNISNPTPPTGYLLRLWTPLYVESNSIWRGTFNAQSRKFIYDTDWSANINPVTTAGGGLISVGVPVYPLVMDVYCSPGEAIPESLGNLRFSRNSANSTPAITVTQSTVSGYDADTFTYIGSNYYVMGSAYLELVTGTAQVRVLRSGTFSTGRLPTVRISSYSWSN